MFPANSLYLIEFLHQTTTYCVSPRPLCSCILLNFYIKPQLLVNVFVLQFSCILLNFYIKPQLFKPLNSNTICCILLNFYIKPQLGRTGFVQAACCILLNFYIKPQLLDFLCVAFVGCILLNFYIKPQLKQCHIQSFLCCILLNFYIKPQLPVFPVSSWMCCILLNFYIKPQRRDGYRLILRILQPFDDSRNLLSVRRRSRFDVFFRISKNKYSKISQKNSNCWGISGFARSLFPQKFRISPYCLSVTARMLV